MAAGHHCRPRPYRQWFRARKNATGGKVLEGREGMIMGDGKSGLQLRSLLKKDGELEVSLVNVPTPEPAEDEVVVRVEGTPINPSDLGLLFHAADMSTAKVSGSKDA